MKYTTLALVYSSGATSMRIGRATTGTVDRSERKDPGNVLPAVYY